MIIMFKIFNFSKFILNRFNYNKSKYFDDIDLRARTLSFVDDIRYNTKFNIWSSSSKRSVNL